jgi:hypothetical protein
MNTQSIYRTYILSIASVAIMVIVAPVGIDWQTWNITTISDIQSPYSMHDFTGMPFAFFVLPHALLQVSLGNAINLTLNIMVMVLVARKYAGAQWHIAIAIAMTSPMFANLLMSNNIDWIPLAAFLVDDWLAYPLLAMKPQVLAGAAIIRFKRNPYVVRLLPLFAMLIMSVLLWGAWWQHLGNGLTALPWNFAPFPYMIPMGVYLLWFAWKQDDEIIAAASTGFFVPYFAPYSLAGLHLLLACRHRKAAIWLWCFSWWFLIVSIRRL